MARWLQRSSAQECGSEAEKPWKMASYTWRMKRASPDISADAYQCPRDGKMDDLDS